MRIKLKYPDVETFIQKYAVNISRGGIFIATKQPKPVGTFVQVRVPARRTRRDVDHSRRGAGAVDQGVRSAAQPSKAHGMGVKFSRLDADIAGGDRSRAALARRARRPIRAAPMPDSDVVGAHRSRTRTESQARPLPSATAPPVDADARAGADRAVARRARGDDGAVRLEPPVRSLETNEPLPPMPPRRGETRPIAIRQSPSATRRRSRRPDAPSRVESTASRSPLIDEARRARRAARAGDADR